MEGKFKEDKSFQRKLAYEAEKHQGKNMQMHGYLETCLGWNYHYVPGAWHTDTVFESGLSH